MKPQTVINKMREYTQDFREQLGKGDIESIPALIENVGTFFRELMQEIPRCEFEILEISTFVVCVDRFGTSCAQQDLEKAAATLNEMEDVIRSVEERCQFEAV